VASWQGGQIPAPLNFSLLENIFLVEQFSSKHTKCGAGNPQFWENLGELKCMISSIVNLQLYVGKLQLPAHPQLFNRRSSDDAANADNVDGCLLCRHSSVGAYFICIYARSLDVLNMFIVHIFSFSMFVKHCHNNADYMMYLWLLRGDFWQPRLDVKASSSSHTSS